MRWKGREESQNIEDRRGMTPRMAAGGGIGVIVIALIVMLMGGDPSALLNQAGAPSQGGSAQQEYRETPEEKESKEMVGVVLRDTEVVWNKLFRQSGMQYEEPKLVLFSGQVQSACGMASAAVGPFYCGQDKSVYLDMSFFREMRDRFRAAGDFAQAYVIAHEVGHHIQNLLGTLDQVHQARRRLSEEEYNKLSVRLELQADFYAGVWAHHAQSLNALDEQDIREAVTAADAIGDDKLQQQSQGYVVPDSFTHGSSEQRVRWFLRGFKSGDMSQGDTFSARQL